MNDGQFPDEKKFLNVLEEYRKAADYYFKDMLEKYAPAREALDTGRVTEDDLKMFSFYNVFRDQFIYKMSTDKGIPEEEMPHDVVDKIVIPIVAALHHEIPDYFSYRLENIRRAVENIEPLQYPEEN